MGKIITFHSFQGGVGKSTLIANFAQELAEKGKKVAVIDFDISSPSLHIIFDIQKIKMKKTINDFLSKRANLSETAYELIKDHLYLFPASLNSSDIVEIMRDGYDTHQFFLAVKELMATNKYDFLIIDTPPGINQDALIACSLSDMLILVLKPEKQHFEGCGVFFEFAARVHCADTAIIINKCPSNEDKNALIKEAKDKLNYPILGCLLFSDTMFSYRKSGLFVKNLPDDPLSIEIKKTVKLL